MKNLIREYFKDLTGFESRAFQQETIFKILNRQNALLRAPTGSGKTETAIAPFLFAKVFNIDFPKKLIYIVPLRTLANSLRERTQKMIQRWEEKHPLKRSLLVTLQTGENPEDPRFEGDIIFCTIDQILSSFLNIPYSVGRGSANVNAGVAFASYLVFDELHLLDPDRSFATTLKVLQQVRGISPFLLMTATLTHELAAQIQKEIAPRKISPDDGLRLINVEGDDLAAIEGKRQRLFQIASEALTAERILQDIQQHKRKRVIVICNTVAKSQGLFSDLKALNQHDTLELTLLHSRFLPEDRAQKETALKEIFKERWEDDGKCYVLISTQVIEAGINITCEVMHTELAPMNALLQRAGRCARFTGEEGAVLVYWEVQVSAGYKVLAFSEDDDQVEAKTDKRPKRRFLPYDDDICQLTWEVLQAYASSAKGSQPVGYEVEASWVNQVHLEEDQKQARKRKDNRDEFSKQFNKAIFEGETAVARDLIRLVDNRSVFMIEETPLMDADTPEVKLWDLQPFSLPISTLCKIWREFQASHSQNWIFKRIEQPQGKRGEGYSLPVAVPIKTRNDLVTSVRLLVNPKYASYDEHVGLQIGIDIFGDSTSRRKPVKTGSKEYSYHMDTYLGHLGRMWISWQNDFSTDVNLNGQLTSVAYCSVRNELLQAGGRFIQTKVFPTAPLAHTEALFELLVFLAVLTHDLGKLQIRWQDVMSGWQAIAHQEFHLTNPANHLLAHTDYDPEKPSLKQRYDGYMEKHQRPPHAVESAFLCCEILKAILCPILENQFHANDEQITGILSTVMMAAGRHHSAWAKGWQSDSKSELQQIQLHDRANQVIAQSWKILSRQLPQTFALPCELPRLGKTISTEEFTLNCFTPDQMTYQQLYWLVVRGLRLCDGRSVQLH